MSNIVTSYHRTQTIPETLEQMLDAFSVLMTLELSWRCLTCVDDCDVQKFLDDDVYASEASVMMYYKLTYCSVSA